MSRFLRIILSLACIPLGYLFLYISWDGVYDFGVLINSTLFCAGPVLILGGFIYFIVLLNNKDANKSNKSIVAKK